MLMKNEEIILEAIRSEVEGRQAFLEKDLTMLGLAERLGLCRNYVSEVLNARLGGFYLYVGRCRAKYVKTWRRKHPRATLAEAIKAAGFRSRSTYYEVLRRMKR